MSSAAPSEAGPQQRKPKKPDQTVGMDGSVFDDVDFDGLAEAGSKASTVQREQNERLVAQLKAVRLLQRDQSVPTVLLNIAHGKAVDRPVLPQDEFLSQAIAAMVDSSHVPAERRLVWNSTRRSAEDDIWAM